MVEYKKYKNIREIPANLTCGDLMDLCSNLNEVVDDYEGISEEKKQVIRELIFVKIERKILDAIDAHLGTKNNHHLENTANNPWSTSPQIPTITHNINEFGHTPKRNSAPKKQKHRLYPTDTKDINNLRNLSRLFCEWEHFKKYANDPFSNRIQFSFKSSKMTLVVDPKNAKVIMNFHGFYNIKSCSFPINRNDGKGSKDFWRIYSRRVTKTIAKIIRKIENDENNWLPEEIKNE